MDGTTAVWLGLTLAAPLTLVPQIALVRLLHSRRANWHPLDVLLVSLIVGQLCCTLAALALSAAALARHAGVFLARDDDNGGEVESPLCTALVSFWAAAHTLHAATLTSMAVDRAMTVRWPYKYRVSVRRTQVRYHVVVLAVVSVLVGVATLFASSGAHHAVAFPPVEEATPQPPPPTDVVHENLTDAAAWPSAERQMMPDLSCTFLPYLFDARFSLFWICLHGILLIATLSAGTVVIVTKIVVACCSGDLVGLASGSGSDMRTLGHASDGSSGTLPPPPTTTTPTTAATMRYSMTNPGVSPVTRSAKPMFPATPTTATMDKGFVVIEEKCWNKQRHSTVAAVLVVAYVTHHLPLLVLTTLGTFFGHVLPADWPYSAIVLASSLGSSLLVMAALVVVDPSVHSWMMDSLAPSRRRRRRHHRLPLGHRRSPATSESATLEQSPMKIDDEYRISQIYSTEAPEAKFPLTNGSLFVHLMNPPDSTGARANRRPSRMGVSAYDQRQHRASNATTLASSTHSSMYLDGNKAPPLLTFMSRSKLLSLNGLEAKPEPLYNDPGEFARTHDEAMNAVLVSSLTGARSTTSTSTASAGGGCGGGGKFGRNQEPIYASLSETVSSCNTLDSLGARILGEALERDEAQTKVRRANASSTTTPLDSDESDSDVGSATESAGDDFEFHNIRTSRQTLISPDGGVVEALRPRSRVARSATYRVLCNGLDVKCAKRPDDDDTVPKVIAASESRHGLVTCVTIKVDENLERSCSLRKSKLLTSLSMNDIDIIGASGSGSEADECAKQLPRSDSLFSLDRSPQGGQSALELSRLPLDGRRPRKPQRPSIQQHLEQLERHQFDHVHLRKKSSRRTRTAVLRRFHDRVQQQQHHDSGFGSSNGTPTGTTPVKSVVSIAALKAALSHSPMSYLDNGDVYPASQSRTVFVSEYI